MKIQNEFIQKWLKNDPKMTVKWPKNDPKWLRNDPKWPKNDLNWRRNNSKWLRTDQKRSHFRILVSTTSKIAETYEPIILDDRIVRDRWVNLCSSGNLWIISDIHFHYWYRFIGHNIWQWRLRVMQLCLSI